MDSEEAVEPFVDSLSAKRVDAAGGAYGAIDRRFERLGINRGANVEEGRPFSQVCFLGQAAVDRQGMNAFDVPQTGIVHDADDAVGIGIGFGSEESGAAKGVGVAEETKGEALADDGCGRIGVGVVCPGKGAAFEYGHAHGAKELRGDVFDYGLRRLTCLREVDRTPVFGFGCGSIARETDAFHAGNGLYFCGERLVIGGQVTVSCSTWLREEKQGEQVVAAIPGIGLMKVRERSGEEQGPGEENEGEGDLGNE